MKLICSILLTTLFFASSFNVKSHDVDAINNNDTHNVRYVKDASSNSSIDTTIYKSDFDTLNVGLNNDAIYQQTILGIQPSNVSLETITNNETTMIKGTILNSGQILYMGSGQNKGRGGFDFVEGMSYRVKMHLELNLSEGGKLYMAPWLREWTAINVDSTGVYDATYKGVNQNPFVKNASYLNNKLQFDFCYLGNTNGDKFIQVEALSCSANDTFIIGDIEVIELDTYLLSQDYSLLLKNNTVNSYDSLFYTTGFEEATIMQDGSDSVATFRNNALNGNTWPAFYFHHLSTNYGYHNISFEDNKSYTVSIEFTKWDTTNMWIFFVEGNGNSLNYENGNFSVCTGWEFFFTDYSFVDNVLRFTVHPNSSLKSLGSDAMIKLMFQSNEKALDIRVKSIVIEDEDMIDAKLYSKQFLDVTSVCDPTGTTNNITEEMWNELKTKYEALSSISKENVKSATSNTFSKSIIDRAVSRYDYIASKYGFENFINRDVQLVKFNVFFFDTKSDNLFYFVALISSVSVICLLTMLVKRKYSRR